MSKTKKPKPTPFYLKVRAYKGETMLDVWLCENIGAGAHAGRMFGSMYPDVADRVLALFPGLDVVRETQEVHEALTAKGEPVKKPEH